MQKGLDELASTRLGAVISREWTDPQLSSLRDAVQSKIDQVMRLLEGTGGRSFAIEGGKIAWPGASADLQLELVGKSTYLLGDRCTLDRFMRSELETIDKALAWCLEDAPKGNDGPLLTAGMKGEEADMLICHYAYTTTVELVVPRDLVVTDFGIWRVMKVAKLSVDERLRTWEKWKTATCKVVLYDAEGNALELTPGSDIRVINRQAYDATQQSQARIDPFYKPRLLE